MNTFTHGWGMGLGWLIPILIFAVLFYLLKDKKKEPSDAQDILDKRYANGGIDTKEYNEKSAQLKDKALKG